MAVQVQWGLLNQGSGTLTLTGANTYSGTTIISGGTLQIGNNGTTGDLGTGNITDNANLAFDFTNNPTVSTVISGTGALTQNGTGTLTLTGNNTYSGGTIVNAGTLTVGAGGTLGASSGGLTVSNTTSNVGTDSRAESFDDSSHHHGLLERHCRGPQHRHEYGHDQ